MSAESGRPISLPVMAARNEWRDGGLSWPSKLRQPGGRSAGPLLRLPSRPSGPGPGPMLLGRRRCCWRARRGAGRKRGGAAGRRRCSYGGHAARRRGSGDTPPAVANLPPPPPQPGVYSPTPAPPAPRRRRGSLMTRWGRRAAPTRSAWARPGRDRSLSPGRLGPALVCLARRGGDPHEPRVPTPLLLV